jgi:hypothetical protein
VQVITLKKRPRRRKKKGRLIEIAEREGNDKENTTPQTLIGLNIFVTMLQYG